MLLETGPAQTLPFMVLGFAVILGTMALYSVSILTRYRRLQQELMALVETEQV